MKNSLHLVANSQKLRSAFDQMENHNERLLGSLLSAGSLPSSLPSAGSLFLCPLPEINYFCFMYLTPFPLSLSLPLPLPFGLQISPSIEAGQQTKESYQLQLALALRVSSLVASAADSNFLDFNSDANTNKVSSSSSFSSSSPQHVSHRFW
ncbi:hypothetical protein Goshw_007363, partial [Gossypium schwendimanii]|nr:hypothetical protein [Gossypium schwendimanii]